MSHPWAVHVLVRDVVTAPDSPFSTSERMVALGIADHFGENPVAWPSRRRLAGWTGLSVTAVKAATRRLCEGPERIFDVELGGSAPGQPPRANRYRVAVRPGQEATRVPMQPGHDAAGAPDDRDPVGRRLQPGREATPNVSRTSQRPFQPPRNSGTERRRKALEALPTVATVAEAYRAALGRRSVTLATLEAARRGLEAGATVEDLSRIARAIGAAVRTPSLAPSGGLLAWAVEHNKLDAGYLFRPDNVDKLTAEAEAVLRASEPASRPKLEPEPTGPQFFGRRDERV